MRQLGGIGSAPEFFGQGPVTGRARRAGKVVCIVSGGNIDPDIAAEILLDGGTRG